jgi:hypothetical protein
MTPAIMPGPVPFGRFPRLDTNAAATELGSLADDKADFKAFATAPVSPERREELLV